MPVVITTRRRGVVAIIVVVVFAGRTPEGTAFSREVRPHEITHHGAILFRFDELYDYRIDSMEAQVRPNLHCPNPSLLPNQRMTMMLGIRPIETP